MTRIARIAVAAALMVGCATVGRGPPTALVSIAGNVADATVWIDDHLAGKLSDFASPGKRVRVGFHRIEVRAPGYYSFFEEVDAATDAAVSIRADLHELLP